MPHHHRHPHPPHHQHNGPPPPPHHYERAHWQPPLPTEHDLQLLEELLGNVDEARAVYRILTSCPPEVAAIGGLVLRLFERISTAIPEGRHAQLEQVD